MNTLSVIARDNERIVSNRYGYSCESIMAGNVSIRFVYIDIMHCW